MSEVATQTYESLKGPLAGALMRFLADNRNELLVAIRGMLRWAQEHAPAVETACALCEAVLALRGEPGIAPCDHKRLLPLARFCVSSSSAREGEVLDLLPEIVSVRMKAPQRVKFGQRGKFLRGTGGSTEVTPDEDLSIEEYFRRIQTLALEADFARRNPDLQDARERARALKRARSDEIDVDGEVTQACATDCGLTPTESLVLFWACNPNRHEQTLGAWVAKRVGTTPNSVRVHMASVRKKVAKRLGLEAGQGRKGDLASLAKRWSNRSGTGPSGGAHDDAPELDPSFEAMGYGTNRIWDGEFSSEQIAD